MCVQAKSMSMTFCCACLSFYFIYFNLFTLFLFLFLCFFAAAIGALGFGVLYLYYFGGLLSYSSLCCNFCRWLSLIAQWQQSEYQQGRQRPQMREDGPARPPTRRGLVSVPITVTKRCHPNARWRCRRGGRLVSLHLHCKGQKRDEHYK